MIQILIIYLFVVIDEIYRIPIRILFHLICYNQDMVNLYHELIVVHCLPEDSPERRECEGYIEDWPITMKIKVIVLGIYSTISAIWCFPTMILFNIIMRNAGMVFIYSYVYKKYDKILGLGTYSYKDLKSKAK